MADTAPSPTRFGKYELVARLARGGMAETFRARLQGAAGVTKQVVIKKVLPHFSEDEAFVSAFINEAKLSASLSHGNIAQVFDFGQVDGDYFIAMELVDGRSLAQMLTRAGEIGFPKLPVSIACHLAMEILRGLQYAHTRLGEDGKPLQLVHRDVTPENVLIGFEGQTKVVDFGVAKAVLRGRKETEPGLVKGKFQFFSPEQATAEPLDGRSDVWAVGVILYRMLCGELPFQGQMHTVMNAIVRGNFKPAAVVNPSLPSALSTVLARALAVDRDQRYSSALEMQDAIAGFLYRQDATFSAETIKEWMVYLFSEQLAESGRSTSVSARFEKQLATWGAEGGTTNPAGQATTRSVQAHVPTSTRSPLLPWAAGALALVIGGIVFGMLSHEPPATDPSPLRPLRGAKVGDVVELPIEPSRAEPLPAQPQPAAIVRDEVDLPDAPRRPRPNLPPKWKIVGGPWGTEPGPATVTPAESQPAPVAAAVYEDGRRLFKEKRYPAAKTQFEKCIKLDPKHYECHKLLGTVYAKMNNPAAGAVAYKEFLRLAPPDNPAVPQVKAIIDAFEKPH